MVYIIHKQAKNRFERLQVFGNREGSHRNTEFLVYLNNEWRWIDGTGYMPYDQHRL